MARTQVVGNKSLLRAGLPVAVEQGGQWFSPFPAMLLKPEGSRGRKGWETVLGGRGFVGGGVSWRDVVLADLWGASGLILQSQLRSRFLTSNEYRF